MSTDNKKFIAVVVGSLVCLFVLFIFVLLQVLAPAETTPTQTAPVFPGSSERTDVGSSNSETNEGSIISTGTSNAQGGNLVNTNANPSFSQTPATANWQDTIVDYGGLVTLTNSTQAEEIATLPTYQIDDAVSDGLILDYEPYYQFFPTPATVTLGNGNGPTISTDALETPEKFAEAINPNPSVKDSFSDNSSCGSIEVSGSIRDIETLQSSLSEYEESDCLGEAILADCEPAWVHVTTPEKSNAWVYVSERADGVCGIGLTYTKDFVRLCDVAEAINNSTGENHSLSEWREVYADFPAEIIASIFGYEDLVTDLSSLDCVLTQMK